MGRGRGLWSWGVGRAWSAAPREAATGAASPALKATQGAVHVSQPPRDASPEWDADAWLGGARGPRWGIQG